MTADQPTNPAAVNRSHAASQKPPANPDTGKNTSKNTSKDASKDQQHPQWSLDRQTVNTLLEGQPSDYNLAELARLRIRYQGFPGARDIQADLDQVMQQWQLTEAALFERTRAIHQTAQVYRGRNSQREDWS
jgi:hypothetical protein